MAQPLLDLTLLLTDPDLADDFIVFRRTASVGSNGRAVVTLSAPNSASGPVDPGGGRSNSASGRKRRISTDSTTVEGTIVLYSNFPFSSVAVGLLPDLILWGGATYVVMQINDYSRIGAGWVEVVATLKDLVEQPPAGP